MERENLMIAWIGVDPGTRGAVAVIDGDGGHDFLDWPGDPSPVVDKIRSWLLTYHIRLAALEQVHSMPRQGVSSTFKFGTNYGIWQGILSALSVPYVTVTPRNWQKGLVLPSAGPTPKQRSLAVARSLFPNADLSRQKDHGRADALLIAWWAKRETGR